MNCFDKSLSFQIANDTVFKWSSPTRSPFEAQCETMNLNRKPPEPVILTSDHFDFSVSNDGF